MYHIRPSPQYVIYAKEKDKYSVLPNSHWKPVDSQEDAAPSVSQDASEVEGETPIRLEDIFDGDMKELGDVQTGDNAEKPEPPCKGRKGRNAGVPREIHLTSKAGLSTSHVVM